jgi:UDP-N-acetylglucosamine:LPS N-acetylglucosamine transferase
VKAVNEPNLYFAPSTGMILCHKEEYEKAMKSLEDEKIRFCFISAPELDNYNKIWNTNSPVHRYSDLNEVKALLKSVSGCALILDGIYPDKDAEYLDVKVINNL